MRCLDLMIGKFGPDHQTLSFRTKTLDVKATHFSALNPKPKSQTLNSQPLTLHPTLPSLNPNPNSSTGVRTATRGHTYPTPHTLKPYSQTLLSYPQTLLSYPKTLNHYPQTLNSYPSPLNPYPQTLNPYPQTLNPGPSIPNLQTQGLSKDAPKFKPTP